ncbi:nuclear transport factor 2 family protein [Mesorhizobium retamae]|uniref:Nuclear transport factor 2 family protein n=1 Tax=Mesorhizobium retamae TaxID=2912854 RepID=A0ABS9Q802_9HYPH|nr:nuclear transport factor 2 family protein [Mesorhizobium sp. IRAMC:0171]MCG7503528.1 nuclear transport factor 2 family protein [Mesorhizobium sp. IRAMC:0171]
MPEPDIAFFRSLEQNLHCPDIRRSRDVVGQWLADDFIEFGSFGSVYDKPAILDALAKEPVSGFEPTIESDDFAMQVLF